MFPEICILQRLRASSEPSTYCFWPLLMPRSTSTFPCALKSHNTFKLWFIIVLAGVMAGVMPDVVTAQQRHKVFKCWYTDSSSSLVLIIITFRWTTSCCRMCVMRRLWLRWRTPLTWFTWRWLNQDLCISTTCMPHRITPAVRIYLFLLFHSS